LAPAGDRQIGRTTMAHSPTLEKPIAMARSEREFAAPGAQVAIDIRGRQEPATVVKLPFYRRGRKGNAP
jgi:aminomethyltransferase